MSKLFKFCLLLISILNCACENMIVGEGNIPAHSGTNFINFRLKGVNGKSTVSAFLIENNVIHIIVPNGADLTNVTPEFTHNGKAVYIGDNNHEQESGKQTFDLSNFAEPLIYRIVSDSGKEQKWKVNIYDLPVLMLNTPQREPITSKEERTEGCRLRAFDTDGRMEDLGTAGVKGRGNTTWMLEKKPYNIKLDEKHKLFGMPNSKHWILLANSYYDRTQLHNTIAFEMARLTDFPWVPEGRFIELIFNGEHKGLYYLCEKIRAGKNKINITEMTSDDNSDEAITGGYLLESYIAYDYDGVNPFKTKYYNRTGYDNNYILAWEIKEPDEDIRTQQQYNYIVSAMNKMEEVIADDELVKKGIYRDLLDIESAINWFLVEEIAANEEASRTKNFTLYKDRGDKFRVGPPWDFDAWTFGQAGTDAYMCRFWSFYYPQLLKDPVFVKRFKEKWAIYKPIWIERIPEFMTTQYLMIYRSAIRNEKMWDNWHSINQYPELSYAGYCDLLDDAFFDRIKWFDANLDTY